MAMVVDARCQTAYGRANFSKTFLILLVGGAGFEPAALGL
jgi:hypothetical protein